MFTSVTNVKRLKRTGSSYGFLTIFLFIFSRIYESLSYGEVSFFMHYLFLVPATGGALLVFLLLFKNMSRFTFNLWNSGIATITAGFLFRGIVNLSGRSTTLDAPYYYVGMSFLFLALMTLLLTPSGTVAPKSKTVSTKH